MFSISFLIYLISFVIVTVNILLVLNKIDKVKPAKYFIASVILFFLLFDFMNEITFYLIVGFINIVSYYLIRKKVFLGLFTTIWVGLLLILIDNFLSFILLILGIEVIHTSTYYLYSVLIFITSISVTVKVVKMKKISMLEKMKLNINVVIILFLTLYTLLIMNISIELYDYSINRKILLIFMTILVIILAFILMNFLLKYINESIEKEANARIVELQKNNFDEVKNVVERYVEFNHYTSNIIISMESIIEKGDIGEIKEYFNQNIKLMSKQLEEDIVIILSLNINDEVLRTVFISKIILLKSKGIDIQLKINSEVDIKYIKIIDLIKIFGEIFDNVIKYSKSEVIIVIEEVNNRYLIKIINDFEISKKDTGFGLTLIKKITESYDDIKFDYYIEEKNFVTSILL